MNTRGFLKIYKICNIAFKSRQNRGEIYQKFQQGNVYKNVLVFLCGHIAPNHAKSIDEILKIVYNYKNK